MRPYDTVVVGAGIVGLTVAREVVSRRPGAKVAVIEKEAGVAAHQTGHNSGVVHGGVYYQPGSLKARLCVEGAALMYEYAQEHQIPHERCGKLVVAVDTSELGRLDHLEQRGIANRVPGLRRIDGHEIADIEPNATGLCALHAPETGVIDYSVVARHLHRELIAQDVDFFFDTTVADITETSSCRISTSTGPVDAARVIVCAGLWSDRLASASGANPDPRIVPFRGVYLRLKETAEPLVRGMVYPVPDPTLPFLGVHVTTHIDGHVMLGPSAMLVPSRDAYRFSTVRTQDLWDTLTWPGTWRLAKNHWRTGLHEIHMATSKRAYLEAAAKYVPSLQLGQVDNSFHSGVRAQAVGRDGTLVDDFVITRSGAVTHIRNAPSPAATSSFALAREILDRIG